MRFIILFLLLLAAAFLQGLPIVIFGLKLNLVLPLLLAAAFLLKDFLSLAILILAAILFLRFQPIFFWPSAAVGLIALATFAARGYLPWQDLINLPLLLLAATVIFYAMVDWQYLTSSYYLVFLEAVYNTIIGSTVFVVLNLWLKNRS